VTARDTLRPNPSRTDTPTCEARERRASQVDSLLRPIGAIKATDFERHSADEWRNHEFWRDAPGTEARR
jgi:hypothetical protein